MALALDNPWRLICHQAKETETETFVPTSLTKVTRKNLRTLPNNPGMVTCCAEFRDFISRIVCLFFFFCFIFFKEFFGFRLQSRTDIKEFGTINQSPGLVLKNQSLIPISCQINIILLSWIYNGFPLLFHFTWPTLKTNFVTSKKKEKKKRNWTKLLDIKMIVFWKNFSTFLKIKSAILWKL